MNSIVNRHFSSAVIPSAILGQVFDRLGWTACVAGLAISLTLAAVLAFRLKMSSPKGLMAHAI
jgi:YNFM family putative membrane transporter